MENKEKEIKVIEEREILGQKIRIYGTFDEPLFLAKDVAEWIDYSKNSQGKYNVTAMISTIDEKEKLIFKTKIPGDTQKRNVIMLTEDGLKQVLANSRKSKAKEILTKLEDSFVYKKTPKQTEFELMLKNALDCHLKQSGLDWKYCPFNNKEDYKTTYDELVFFETEKKVGKYKLDFYFPKFNLVVEYDENHHKYQKQADKEREIEIIKILESINDYDISEDDYLTHFIRVQEGKEFEGIINIISYLMHYAFVC